MRFGLRRPSRAPETPVRVPEGVRVYAVGDIHGRDDLLDRMAELIAADLRDRPAAETLMVCLGDYIDRGPGSARVLDRLARRDLPAPLVALMGNHEELLGRFLAGQLPAEFLFFATAGTRRCGPTGLSLPPSCACRSGEAGARLRDAMPAAHHVFLGRRPGSATRSAITSSVMQACGRACPSRGRPLRT